MADIALDEKIAQILVNEAERRGVTPGELMRWVLGAWATGELHEYRSPAYLRPEPAAIPAGAPRDFTDTMGISMAKMIRMSQAAMGALTCERCTQKLSIGDVERGCCRKCEAPIE